MTAQAVTAMIAAQGLAAIGSAVITVLTYIAIVIGSLFMLIVFACAVAYLLTWRDARKHRLNVVIAPMLTEPETVIDDALPMFFEKRERLHVVRDSTAGSDWDD